MIKMDWISFETKIGQIFDYQDSASKNYLTNLVVKNSILVDTYVQQVKTVNYRRDNITDIVSGSLTFNHSIRVAIITPSE